MTQSWGVRRGASRALSVFFQDPFEHLVVLDRSELARRGSRSPARAALAFLAREYTEATLADLVPVLGVSRPQSVPNLTRRFSTWLESQNETRRDLKKLKAQLGFRNK